MSDIASFRIATCEAKTQARMKVRVEVWWHKNQCPNCQAKVAMLKAMLGATEPVPAFEPPRSLN